MTFLQQMFKTYSVLLCFYVSRGLVHTYVRASLLLSQAPHSNTENKTSRLLVNAVKLDPIASLSSVISLDDKSVFAHNFSLVFLS